MYLQEEKKTSRMEQKQINTFGGGINPSLRIVCIYLWYYWKSFPGKLIIDCPRFRLYDDVLVSSFPAVKSQSSGIAPSHAFPSIWYSLMYVKKKKKKSQRVLLASIRPIGEKSKSRKDRIECCADVSCSWHSAQYVGYVISSFLPKERRVGASLIGGRSLPVKERDPIFFEHLCD